MVGRSRERHRVTLWVLFSMAVAAGICVSVAIFGGLNEPIRKVLEQGGQRILGGRLQIRQLEGNPLFRFQLSGVSWTTSGGDRIQLGEARIQYKPGWMLLGQFYIDSLIVVSPQVSLTSSSGGDARVPMLPTMAIEAVNIQHGVLVLDGEEKPVTYRLHSGSSTDRMRLDSLCVRCSPSFWTRRLK